MAFFGQKSPILHFLVNIFKNKALNKNQKIPLLEFCLNMVSSKFQHF